MSTEIGPGGQRAGLGELWLYPLSTFEAQTSDRGPGDSRLLKTFV